MAMEQPSRRRSRRSPSPRPKILKIGLDGRARVLPDGSQVELPDVPARRMVQLLLPIFGPNCPPPMSPHLRWVARPRCYRPR